MRVLCVLCSDFPVLARWNWVRGKNGCKPRPDSARSCAVQSARRSDGDGVKTSAKCLLPYLFRWNEVGSGTLCRSFLKQQHQTKFL